MKQLEDDNNNFWISYADLMAGLLFVFILVIGAVIVKYNLQEKDSVKLKKDLKETKIQLSKTEKDLNDTKYKIFQITSVKSNIIKKLKTKLGELGDKIKVDSKSGTLIISGNILFNQGEYKLLDDSKKNLDDMIFKYINILISNQDIRNNLDSIIIEGHTNSDGSYLNNLKLSQSRAFSVMQFILQKHPESKKYLEKYLTATGRSENELIIKNGIEDKNASRRIEVKFRLRNDELLRNIAKQLSK